MTEYDGADGSLSVARFIRRMVGYQDVGLPPPPPPPPLRSVAEETIEAAPAAVRPAARSADFNLSLAYPEAPRAELSQHVMQTDLPGHFRPSSLHMAPVQLSQNAGAAAWQRSAPAPARAQGGKEGFAETFFGKLLALLVAILTGGAVILNNDRKSTVRRGGKARRRSRR